MWNNRVIWSEGMFLEPQHFQQQERYFEHIINQKTNLCRRNNYGFLSYKIDHEMLALGKFSLTQCSCVFNDGTVYNAPTDDILPTPIELSNKKANIDIYISLPLKQIENSECYQSNKRPYRYQGHVTRMTDYVSEKANTSEINIAKLAPNFSLSLDNIEDHVYLKIAHVSEVTNNREIILDKRYIPSCISIECENILSEFIDEMSDLLEYRAKTIATSLANSQQDYRSIITNVPLLQLLNRYSNIFSHHSYQKNLHPEKLYCLAIQLLGEISVYVSGDYKNINYPAYELENLYNVFEPIFSSIRKALKIIIEERAIAITLERNKSEIWSSEKINDSLIESSSFILSAQSEATKEIIQKNLPNQIKITSQENIRDLIDRSLPGISIESISNIPKKIQPKKENSYFILNKSHDYWNLIKKSGHLTIHISEHYPNLKLNLWAIKN